MELRTKRLHLRPVQICDADAMTKILSNFAISGNLAVVPHPYTLQDAVEFITRVSKDVRVEEVCYVILAPNGTLMGIVSIHHKSNVYPTLGYYLGENFWGQGIMTEAARAVVKQYFEKTDHDRLNCGAFAFNTASLAVQHKLGFVETGGSRLYNRARQQEMDHIDMELTREDYEASL